MDTEKMIIEAGSVMDMLVVCANDPGADITITVTKDTGETATAHLYDLAALTESLYSALEYFIEEMT